MTSGKPLACETKWSSLQRPLYSPGLLLEDEDLNAGISYTQAMMRLMLRSLFGCGVICGLKVTVVPTCQDTRRRIDVSKGVAVDGEGNLIEVAEPWSYEFGPDCNDGWPDRLWVVVCYTEQYCRPKDVACGLDDDGGSKQTRVRAGYKIKVSDHPPKCACRCATPVDDDDEEDGGGAGCCGGAKKRRTTLAATSTAATTGEAPTTPGAAAPTASLDPCACYEDHFNGVCDCGCSCRCVVLARIPEPGTIVRTDEKDVALAQPVVTVDATMVRRVRPVLTGYLDCRFPRDTSAHDEPADDLTTEAAAMEEENQELTEIAARIRTIREKRRALQKAQKAKTKKDRPQVDNG